MLCWFGDGPSFQRCVRADQLASEPRAAELYASNKTYEVRSLEAFAHFVRYQQFIPVVGFDRIEASFSEPAEEWGPAGFVRRMGELRKLCQVVGVMHIGPPRTPDHRMRDAASAGCLEL